MRRYELMLVFRPDVADDRSQAVIDRITRQITAAWRPDREGRPVGPPTTGLSHRPLPRGLVPHRAVRRRPATPSSSSSTACSSPRRSSATSSSATSARSRRAARGWHADGDDVRRRRSARPASTRKRKRMIAASGSARTRARRLRPPSTEEHARWPCARSRSSATSGRDPELRYTPNGRPVTQFNVAVNQCTKNQQTGEWIEETDWFRVSVWGDRAERMAETPPQGQQGVRRRPLQDPRVRGPRRPEADLARHHRRLHRQAREPRRATPTARSPARRRRQPAGPLRRRAAAVGGCGAAEVGDCPSATRPPSDDTDLDDPPSRPSTTRRT